MTRIPAPIKHYKDELIYCELIDVESTGETFNFDPACFRRYVRMQARLASLDGYGDIGKRLLDVIGE